MDASNPYAVVTDENVVHRRSAEDALFSFVCVQRGKDPCFVLAYEDRLQFWQGDATYELGRYSRCLYSRLTDGWFKRYTFEVKLEKRTEFKLEPAEFLELKEWVGPPRHSDLLFAIVGPSWALLTVMLLGNSVMAAFRAGSFAPAVLLGLYALYPVIQYALARLVAHRFWFVLEAMWYGGFPLLASFDGGANVGTCLILGLLLLSHVGKNLRNFLDFQFMTPDVSA